MGIQWPLAETIPNNHPQGSLLASSWEDLGDAKQLAGRHQGAEPIPSTQLAHRCLFLWFYYYKCTMGLSHSGNLDSTCSSTLSFLPGQGQSRSIQTMCRYKTYLTETVQLIAYSDAVSPAVQELYRTMPGVSRMPDCLIHICKLQDAVVPLYPGPWHGREIPCFEEVLSGSRRQAMTARSVYSVG